MGIGMRELLIILVVVLLVFGTKKLKNIGSDLGGAVRGFKKAMSDGEQEGTEVAKQLQQAAQVQPDAEFPEVKAAAGPAAAPPKGPAA
jgi:sec-independent protein translocase protein TatA